LLHFTEFVKHSSLQINNYCLLLNHQNLQVLSKVQT